MWPCQGRAWGDCARWRGEDSSLPITIARRRRLERPRKAWMPAEDHRGGGQRSGTVAYYLAVFFDTLEERRPFHEVGQVEVEVVVFGEGVEVAEVELQEVRGPNAAHRRHGGWSSGPLLRLEPVVALVVLLSIHYPVQLYEK
jgi:hypothetical protein